ncbi:MAG: rod shape-determining protein MreC [Candidatus Rokubacteria bacterium]|nr:rod shape-determining protein MreC [Candidatus Rokubacteria bacterium]MBI3826983.1 rod shape-determining protein MreC [Candidatus Rokubacteria bacterium]
MKIRRLTLLGSVAGLCLLLLSLQTRGHASGAADALARVTVPVQSGVAAVNRAAHGVWATYLDWKNVRGENRRLREENRQLRVESLWVSETTEENLRLRRLLALHDRLPVPTMAGEVIAREWGGWVRSLTVNRGRADQVARLTAVISPEGLVGRVVEVRPGASIVQVLTDPASTVGAHVVRTRTAGIVEGEPRGTIRFKYLAREGGGIQAGDLVVTAGLSGVFPRGIPIGRVTAIDDRGSALFHYAQLAPLVDFARIDEVLLVTGERMQDLTAFFPGGSER